MALMKNTKSAQVVRTLDALPAGCGSGVISPSIVAYILVRVSYGFLVLAIVLIFLCCACRVRSTLIMRF